MRCWKRYDVSFVIRSFAVLRATCRLRIVTGWLVALFAACRAAVTLSPCRAYSVVKERRTLGYIAISGPMRQWLKPSNLLAMSSRQDFDGLRRVPRLNKSRQKRYQVGLPCGCRQVRQAARRASGTTTIGAYVRDRTKGRERPVNIAVNCRWLRIC